MAASVRQLATAAQPQRRHQIRPEPEVAIHKNSVIPEVTKTRQNTAWSMAGRAQT